MVTSRAYSLILILATKKKPRKEIFRLQVSQIKFANKFNKVGANYSILNLAL